MFVAFADTYIIVSPLYVQFSVYVCIAQIAYEVQDEGEWILVTHSEGIDFSVVLYQSQFAILLLYEEEG